MHKLFLKKISDNEFTIGGTIDIFDRKVKSVEVDGETYTKTEMIVLLTNKLDANEILNYYTKIDTNNLL